MFSSLDVPQGIRLYGLLVARNLLLLEAPLRELDLVREEVRKTRGVVHSVPGGLHGYLICGLTYQTEME